MMDFRRKNRSVTPSSKYDAVDLQLSTLHTMINPHARHQSGSALFIKEGIPILESLRNRTMAMDASEKNFCISRGAITILIQCICYCGKNSLSTDIVLEICQHLIDNSHEASRLFCKQLVQHLYDDIECIGTAESLPKLISLYPLRSIFIEDLCIPRLLEIFYKGSISLAHKRNSYVLDKPLEAPPGGYADLLLNMPTSNISVGSGNHPRNVSSGNLGALRRTLREISLSSSKIDDNHSTHNGSNYSSPAESPILQSQVSPMQQVPPLNMKLNLSSSVQSSNNSPSIGRAATTEQPSNGNTTPLSSSSSSVPSFKLSKPIIPKLNLPIRVESSAKMTRSSRRRDDSNSSNRSHTTEIGNKVEVNATKELSDIATKLGETYMTSDLTALISYKQIVDAHFTQTTLKRNSYAPKKFVIPDTPTSESPTVSADLQTIRVSNLYKVRCCILRAVIASTSYNLTMLQYVNNPMNLLYSEIMMIYKGIIPADYEFLQLIFQLASNWADYVEYIHRIRWNDITKDMIQERKGSFRKKLDVLLWRINNNILNVIQTNLVGDLEYQLHMLADYVQFCPTRIMPSQVVDVCIEVLLKIKHYVFKGRLGSERFKDIYLVHYLLCVFDEIITQNMHPPLNELLMAIFLERDDTFHFLRHYTQYLLANDGIEREFSRQVHHHHLADRKQMLTELRCRVIKHHAICVDMLKRTIGESQPNNTTDNDNQFASDLVKKMEYLLVPTGGVILPFLQSSNFFQNYEVKKQMLEFLSSIFYFKKNPFTKKKIYIDAYISYFYISFIKLYNNYVIDSQTLTLCNLFLNILIAFSINKNEKITMKFYQLRTMDFLVREINLEYEVKQNKDQLIEPFFLKASHSTSTNQTVVNNNTNNNNVNSGSGGVNIPKIAIPIPTATNSDSQSTPPLSSTPTSKPKLPPLKLPAKIGESRVGSPSIPPLAIPPKIGENRVGSPSIPPLAIPPKVSTDSSINTTKTGSPSIPPLAIPPKVSTDSSINTTKTGSPSVPLLAIPPKVPPIALSKTDDSIKSDSALPSSTSTTTGSDPTSMKATALNSSGGIGMKVSIPKLTLPLVKTRATESETKDLTKSAQAQSGLLSAIEQKIDPQDPKFQLVFGNPTAPPAHTQSQEEEPANSTEPSAKELLRYKTERNNRKLYHDKDLHISILQLIFSLLLNSNHTLEQLYSDQFPLVAKKLNVPYILQLHINHQQNEKIIPELCQRTQEMGPNYFRVLKLLFNRLYHASLFKDLKRVAKGAYGTVYKGTLGQDEGLEVAVKLMAVPKSIHDRCVLHDIFTEILIMDTFRSDHRACHMFDYGVDGENYWIVMKSYKCSLKEWRAKQTGHFLQQLPLYLNIYMNVLLTVQFLVDNKINHFDIKCDNFLVHPIKKGTIEDDFWNQPTVDPNFVVCLADWGEAKVYSADIEGYTTRNRGTEFIKSPEMLTIAYASQKTRENFDRRKKVGSNTASDVWSLGCLFYELLTGDFLFYEDDWVKFFIRVTQPGQELITPDKKAKIHNIPAIIEFMEFVFVRDPFYRPTLRDILLKFTSIKPTILSQLERLKQELDNEQLNQSGQPKQYYIGGDGTRYKGTNRSSGHYTPGRFFPHTYNVNTIKSSSLASNSIQSRLHEINIIPEITYEPPEFPEHKHFMEFPSKITSYMYISSFNPSMKKNMLKNEFHITHIINCTGSPNAFPDHFEYLHLQLRDDPSQDILNSFTLAFDFIRDAIMHQGRVLIVSDKGVSRAAALAIGYFMDSRSISYFEAFILIRDRRYIVNPNPGFVEQMCRWGRQRRTQKGLAEWGGGIETYINNTTQFQCLCGACVFTLLTPFDSTKGYNNPKHCNCEQGDKDCPNFQGCSTFLKEMKKLHNYNAKHVIWGYTNITNVVGDFQRSSIEIQHPTTKKKDWKLFKCKTCQFLTYALSTTTNPQYGDKPIAIVTNSKLLRMIT